MHRVTVLALPSVVAFDLSTPAQIFGNEPRALRLARCAASAPGRVRHDDGLRDRRPRAASSGRARRTRCIVPGLRPAQLAAAGGGPRCAAGGRTRAARAWPRSAPAPSSCARRPARRPPGHDALGPRRAAGRALSGGHRRSRRALRRRGRRARPRPASPPASISACTSCAATTAPRSPTRRAADRGGAAPRRRPGAVRRARRCPPAGERGLARHARAGRSSASREPLTVAAMARHAALQRAHLRPALPRRDRHHAAAVAARCSASCTPAACWRRPTSRSRTSPAHAGLRHRHLAALAFPPRDGHDTARVSPQLQG